MSNFKLRYKFLLLFSTVSILVFGQYKPGSFSNGILPNVLPSSPEASSLGKYGEWPVSQYTGVPNISVPIYTVKVGSFELPVQLSYHAGGVKIDEVASWVGTNWTLNAGGAITRTVVGLPDENTGGFLYRNQRNLTIKSSYDLTTPADYVYMREVSAGGIDVEPDIFYFNFSGISGKFYFDKNGNFQCIPATSLKLIRSPINNTLVTSDDKHWEIADQNGNLYFFGSYMDGGNGFENTRVYLPGPGGPGQSNLAQPTAWYLTKIILSNSADTIFFDYADKYENYALPDNYSFRVLTAPINYSPPSGNSWENILKLNTVLVNGDSPPGDFSTFSVTGKSMLSKIRWKTGEIDFTATTGRQDINGGKMLDMVTVNNKTGNKIKDVKLKYTYLQQRYYLDSLVEIGSTGTSQIAHAFEYFERNSLPSRGSLAQDHWGYYNSGGNASLLPPEPSINNPSLSADREPDDYFAQFGTLKKITYPTGGYTLFDYECHRYDPASPVDGGNPSSQITPTTLTVKAADPQPENYVRTQNFTVPFTQNTPSINIQFTNYAKPVSKQQAWLPVVKIEHLENGIYQTVYYWDAFDNFPTGNVTANQYGLVDFNLSQSFSLSPGDYRITTDLVCGVPNCGTPVHKPEVTAQFSYSAYNGQLPLAGGLRIKEIANYDTDNVTRKKKFLYEPGKLLIYPKYLHQYGEDVFLQSACAQDPICYDQYYCISGFAKYKEVTSSSQAILGFTQGASVGYTSVKELDVNSAGTENGYTTYSFKFAPDVLNTAWYDGSYWSGINILNPSIPLNNYEYKRGMLSSKEVYKTKADGTYTKIYSLTNDYEFNDDNPANRYNTLRALRVKQMRYVNYRCGTYYNGYMFPTVPPTPDFLYGYYDVITSWVQHTSTTETQYDENGQNPLVKTTTYSYNNPTYLQASSIESSDSKGNPTKTELKYPYDFVGTAVYDAMVAKNMISPVIQEKSFKTLNGSSTLLATSQTDYLTTGNFQKPSVVKTALGNNLLETRVQFNQYDASGNILEQQKANDVVHSYIWGYSNTYLIAEVLNAPTKDIFHTSFEDAEGNSADRDSKTGRKSKTNGYQKTISNLTNGSYVLSYWQKAAGAWSYQTSNVTVSNNTYAISLSAQVDEIRFYPSNARMTTYTYDPLTGVTSQTDVNNRSSYYEYDGFGRLSLVRDQDNNILKKYCYNYAGQPQDCGMDMTPLWQSTGVTRCKSCPANSIYMSNIQEHEEKDNNPYSPTYNMFRWIDDGVSANCVPQADWQLVSTTCQLNGFNQNTGYQIRTEKDMNPCSSTYNTTRQVTVYNTTACPLPVTCSASNCTGVDKKCINNFCESGIKVYTSSVFISTHYYECTYHYEWSNGTWSQNYTEYSYSSCNTMPVE